MKATIIKLCSPLRCTRCGDGVLRKDITNGWCHACTEQTWAWLKEQGVELVWPMPKWRP